MSVNFIPDPPPSHGDRETIEWAQRQFQRIADALNNDEVINLSATGTAPVRPQAGDIRRADGTSWNPGGTGAGFYAYITSWIKL